VVEGFTLLASSAQSSARAGILKTAHGEIQTPVFMPVGTQGSVKALTPRDLVAADARIILGNTYHLYLRPGCDLVAEAGGLHRFISWDRALLTDSGGFQVWSLDELRKIRPEGVEFRSHIDGSKHLFTPQAVMNHQRRLGADIIMAFDECTPYPASEAQVSQSLQLTQRWTESALEWLDKNPPLHGYPQQFFGIVQGGMYVESRLAAIEHLLPFDLPGYAIGGLSVGEPADIMYTVAEACTRVLPAHKPRYVMGVGTPENLLELIKRGVDMFDCVLPTRNARNGTVYTWEGPLHFKAARHAKEFDKPLDSHCSCYACKNFSRAYIRHLFHAGEISALHLASLHSLHFFLSLMKTAREKILIGEFEAWSGDLMRRWQASKASA